MKLLYSDESLPEKIQKIPSIFLAGPTPRHPKVKSWRPEAILHLTALGYNGIVFIPEHKESEILYDYIIQVEWEFKALEMATVLRFWVPRNLQTLPGFTTNVEFGRYVSSCVYGRPAEAQNCRYLDWLYTKITHKQPCLTLMETLREAIKNTA